MLSSGISLSSELYMPAFRNTLCIPHSYMSLKIEQRECSENLAYKIQTPGNYPEESIQHSEHGESLKSGMQVKFAHILVVLTVPIFHFSLCDIFTTRTSTPVNSWIHLFLIFFIKSISGKSLLTLRELHNDLHNRL